jgi:uncharacterized protein (TIGR00297 family)
MARERKAQFRAPANRDQMLNSFLAYSWHSPGRLATAAVVTVGFALLARALRGVDRSGMVAGGVACFVLYAGGGPAAFAALAALFVLTWASTRMGYRRKQELGVAERGEGRNGWQVLANLAVPACGAAIFAVTANRVWLAVVAAALAEAATDTVASEVGQTRSRTALMITTWQRVTAGTDGGITLPGTVAGTLAGMAIAVVAALGGMISYRQLWIPVAAGFVGMLVDSVLGATLQRRGWMNNEAVNLLGTLAAGALGLALGT